MSSVKMASRRVIGTELVNEDNLKGYYLGDGATYYYVRGDEYLEVFPFGTGGRYRVSLRMRILHRCLMSM